LADAVEKASVWTVTVQTGREYPSSGVLYGPGRVITAAHLVENLDADDTLTVSVGDGAPRNAAVRGIHPGYDLALVEFEPVNAENTMRYAKQNARSEAARTGELVLALARPTNEGIQSSLGVINVASGTYRPWHGPGIDGVMRSDASRFPGYAGGPLIDVDGSFIGINVYGMRRQSSLTVPAALLEAMMPDLEAGKVYEAGYLGVRSQVADLSSDRANELGRSTGLLIVGVEEESPATDGGLLVGDIIVALDKKEVIDHGSLLEALGATTAEQTVSASVVRGGELQSLPVIIGARPAGPRKQGRGRPNGHRRDRHNRRGPGQGPDLRADPKHEGRS
jgi:S1-C subfamily serine protease